MPVPRTVIPSPPASRRSALAAVALLCAFLAGCGDDEIPAAPAELLSRQTLFTAGEGGYHSYRIPSLLVTRAGTVLALVEGRRHSRSDTGDIDLLLRRSTDGGATWSSPLVVADLGDATVGNPCLVEDRATGTLWLLLCSNLDGDTEEEIVRGEAAGTRRVHVTASEDQGESWAALREITEQVKAPDMRWYGTGPGVGIQLRHGPHAGRLVIPGDHSYPQPGGDLDGIEAAFGGHVVYSDDHGATWSLGGRLGPDLGEPQVVELADPPGAMLINLRAFTGRHRRNQATSTDGGLAFGPPRDHPTLIEPVCQAGLLRYSWPGQPAGDLILFSNPAGRRRENLVVRASRDGGETWPAAACVWRGPAAYSCLARLPDGRIACLHEAGERSPYERVDLAVLSPTALVGEGAL